MQDTVDLLAFEQDGALEEFVSPVGSVVGSHAAIAALAAAAPAMVTPAANIGVCTGTAPIAFGYQWYRFDATGANRVVIAGAVGATYLLVRADSASTRRRVVAASNPGASTS